MPDYTIAGGKWIVAWVQSTDPDNSRWTIALACSSEIPGKPYPGFEWEIDSSFRYRAIAVLDERSSKLLSLLKGLEDWTGDESYIFEEGINRIVLAAIEGSQKIGRHD